MGGQPPVIFANRYLLIRPLGQGGYGDVYLALDQHRNLQVALKLFRQAMPALAYREAQVLTALEGEHVLRVNNADTFVDVPFLDTRVASGGSAEDQLTGNPFGVAAEVAVRWTRHLLVGLGSCHARNLVHCDIKPSNLFLHAPEHALLGDFGVTQLADPAGSVLKFGTPQTMAPEMIRDGRGTKLSDIYSVGVTLYRLLTGTWPFEGATAAETEAQVVAGAYEPLRDVAPHVSRRLADRVTRAMAFEPADRFASAAAMHDALGVHGLSPRAWQRVAPHPGHERCWIEHPDGKTPHQVCVTATGTTYDIDVRRAAGAQTRIVRYCHAARDEGQLRVRLRDTFDHL